MLKAGADASAPTMLTEIRGEITMGTIATNYTLDEFKTRIIEVDCHMHKMDCMPERNCANRLCSEVLQYEFDYTQLTEYGKFIFDNVKCYDINDEFHKIVNMFWTYMLSMETYEDCSSSISEMRTKMTISLLEEMDIHQAVMQFYDPEAPCKFKTETARKYLGFLLG